MSTRALRRLREERRVQQRSNDGNGNGGVGGGTTTTDGDPDEGEDNGLRRRRRLPADAPDDANDDDGNEEEEVDEEDDDDDDDDDDAVYGGKARVSAFLWHDDDDDDDDDDSDSEDDDDSDADADADDDGAANDGGGDVVVVKEAAPSSPPSAPPDARGMDLPPAAAGEEMQRQKGATTPKEPIHDGQEPLPSCEARADNSKAAAALPRAAGRTKEEDEEKAPGTIPDEDGKAQEEEGDDDWDAILREFRTKDRERAGGAKDEQGGGGGAADAAPGSGPAPSSASEFLLEGLDWTDLDVERARAAAIFAPRNVGANRHRNGGDARGGGIRAPAPANAAATAARRTSRRTTASSANLLFGGPEAGWNRHSPPTYVGGGIGIAPYNDPHHAGEEEEARGGTAAGGAATEKEELPWPYCDTTLILGQGRGAGSNNNNNNRAPPRVGCANAKRWYAFAASDVSRRDADDYRDVIERSGDVTSLLLFVLHHPYCVPALLQASAVLYQTNRSQHAMSMLKRALWVLDCAMQWSVARQWQAGSAVLMDASVNDLNACYFRALKALMRASSHAGYAQYSN
jgi:Transcriptional repressor TCF25